MPRKQKGALIERFGNACHYCGEQTNRVTGHPLQATIEHILPRGFGGANNQSNYVLACAGCNQERGNQLFYCECEYFCAPVIRKALSSQKFIDLMFDGIVDHNTPKVYWHKQAQRWAVRTGHNRLHYDTWQDAMDAAMSWKDK